MRVLAWPAFSNRRLNPYNSLLYEPMAAMGAEVVEFSPKRLLQGEWDVWHLHWPDLLLRTPHARQAAAKAGSLIALMSLARLRGTKVFWTMHNLGSHERLHPRTEAWFWQAFTGRLDGYLSLSRAARDAALERFPLLRQRPGFIIPHGHYRGVYPDLLTRSVARERLGLSQDAPVIANLGLIRKYKNVPHLIRSFRKLDRPDAMLLVAGKCESPELAAEIHAATEADPRVRLRLQFIPDDEVQVYLRAANLVTLPFEEVTNSGSALLALSFDRPVLLPRKGSMQELQSEVGADWVMTYPNDLTANVLEASLRWAMDPRRPQRAPLDKLEWPALAGRTLDAYRAVCAESAP